MWSDALNPTHVGMGNLFACLRHSQLCLCVTAKQFGFSTLLLTRQFVISKISRRWWWKQWKWILHEIVNSGKIIMKNSVCSGFVSRQAIRRKKSILHHIAYELAVKIKICFYSAINWPIRVLFLRVLTQNYPFLLVLSFWSLSLSSKLFWDSIGKIPIKPVQWRLRSEHKYRRFACKNPKLMPLKPSQFKKLSAPVKVTYKNLFLSMHLLCE